MLTVAALWGKLEHQDGIVKRWHSLVDHSADVAAVTAVLLEQPTIRRRLAATAGLPDLDALTRARLAALAFLHDIGKANRGFRARIDRKAKPVGHINELSWLLNRSEATPLFARLCDVLGLDRIGGWFDGEAWPMLEAVFAHHGRPWFRNVRAPDSRKYWEPRGTSDPVAELAPMREKLDLWFAPAFSDGPPMPNTPAMQHAFAGLMMLADWLGSDERFFPFANGQGSDRFSWALSRGREALLEMGLSVESKRQALLGAAPDFRAAFGFEKPHPIQAAMETARANPLVLEAETGSGKTEAALWRFKLLFEQGLVDGLYFALPTRVAATQIFSRVKAFRDRIFPTGNRPGVVLAVPGQARFDEAEARPLPDFAVQWSDDARDTGARWAAERPKRFLAATVAVGTIDQALLGAVRVKHAHLRGTALLRQLLVVDEVHASSAYAGELLKHLLRSHIAAGGHALLLSATLGSAMRAGLLGAVAPDFPSATNVAYPALSWAENGQEIHHEIKRDGRQKAVRIELAPLMRDEADVASRALSAAREGAAVLVIRNTVGAAIKTARAIEEMAGADSPLLFRVADAPTLHHSRFALEDRRLLDAAAEDRLGKARQAGRGIVVVGSQTLEISLDLDADLLITDLCPVDVLLQRIGRLHRHRGRSRPAGCAAPRLILLTPGNRDLLDARLAPYGLGTIDREGRGIYPDLRVIEATWRLAERHAVWTIPDMNRLLVETATHPERLAEIEASDPRWRERGDVQAGIASSQKGAAAFACLDRMRCFTECEIPRDEKFGTRLGSEDQLVTFDPPRMGPFGQQVTILKIPAFLLRGVPPGAVPPDAVPVEVVDSGERISFRLGEVVFSYDRFGLLREK